MKRLASLAACALAALPLGALLLGVLPLGCACIRQPRAQESLTTGDKLRAIDAAERGEPWWERTLSDPAKLNPMRERLPVWCGDLRARLLGNPPSMYAELWEGLAYEERPTTIQKYAGRSPALYPPVDRERTDLRRAHSAGLLSDAELAELESLLAEQARRPGFRLRSESPEVFVEDGITFGGLSEDRGIVSTPDSRRAQANGLWLRLWVFDYANAERVAGAELPNPDPNAPMAKSQRPWRNPSFWVDPRPSAAR